MMDRFINLFHPENKRRCFPVSTTIGRTEISEGRKGRAGAVKAAIHTPVRNIMRKVHALYALCFISAFLLFQIELVIAKIFLPKFGGSYLVWGGCIVFFQFALLMGYLYSHLVIRKFGMHRYRYLHLILMLLPLLFFPGRALPEINAHPGIPLMIDIFLQLSLTIGLAFFVLSTISIVTQSWLAHSDLPERRNPYILYAVSNVGSFLGLLSYPFLFEMYFDLDTQVAIWRILYVLFLLLYLISLRTIDFTNRDVPSVTLFDKSIFSKRYRLTDEAVRRKFYWFLLSAAGCILFLSVTNIITYEIAPSPLLWIIPLCIYLLSFVLTFRDKPLYPGWITEKFHVVMGFSVVIFFFAQARLLPITPQLIAFIVSLFALCMFCQHELYQSRPQDKRELTVFYLIVSLGGFAGSLLVTWVAPRLFTLPLEFLLGLFVVGLSLSLKEGRSRVDLYSLRWIAYAVIFVIAWPLVFKTYNVFGVMLIFLAFSFIFRELNKKKTVLGIGLLIILILAPFVEDLWSRDDKTIRSYRNYYGIYKITASPTLLNLIHGTTLHGAQYLTEDHAKRQEPLTYYHRMTPVGKVLDSGHFATRRIGVVGLGVGTLSAYGKKGEEMDFFELDPDITVFVNVFDYLQYSRAKLNFFYDDARMAVRRMPQNHYDILVIDAFSGDSVPVHLLTTDAVLEYKAHMKDHGLILFHISNRYLDLAPVLFSNAEAVNAFALSDWNGARDYAKFESKWMALTWDRQIHQTLVSQLQWKESSTDPKMKKLRPWTDKYSNIPSVMALHTFVNSIKNFTPFSW
jgi:spermidine synthase